MRDNVGYYRYPAIHKDMIVFTFEDDLWIHDLSIRKTERLTNSEGMATLPVLSRDGKRLAYSGTERGLRDVYLLDVETGRSERMTYTGVAEPVVFKDDDTLVFRTPTDAANRQMESFELDIRGGIPEKLPFGDVRKVDYAADASMLIGRNCRPLYRWKRYRGGTTGQVWQRAKGKGPFVRIITNLSGNLTDPCYVGKRIFFLSDHEGFGNVYSVEMSGKNLVRHTHHQDFFARDLSTDGTNLIYSYGGDLFLIRDGNANARSEKLAIKIRSTGNTLRRRHLSALPYLSGYDFTSGGEHIALSSRGQLFASPTFNGPAIKLGMHKVLRYRYVLWLHDKRRLATLAFSDGVEQIQIVDVDPMAKQVQSIASPNLGRVTSWRLHPQKDMIAFVNHRQELWLLDLAKKKFTLVEANLHGRLSYPCFSPCGTWIAYSAMIDTKRMAIRIAKVANPEPSTLIEPVLNDVNPVFGLDGKFLYFIGVRDFKPVYSGTHFQLSFPHGDRVYCIGLTKESVPKSFQESDSLFSARTAEAKSEAGDKLQRAAKAVKKTKASKKVDEKKTGDKKSGKPAEEAMPPIKIDTDQIGQRVFSLNVDLGDYRTLGVSKDHLFFIEVQNLPSIESSERRGTLRALNLNDGKLEAWDHDVDAFGLVGQGKQLYYRKGKRLRLVSADRKPESSDQTPSKKSGWVDLDRYKIDILPKNEWFGMYDEAWLLQREFFWTADMSKIDWQKAYERYRPLIDRIASRDELSDIIWEMQGELGTSHCYEVPSEQSRRPSFVGVGSLGGAFEYNKKLRAYKLLRTLSGESWRKECQNPLVSILGLKAGDLILAIDGQGFEGDFPLERYLLDRDGKMVYLTFRRQKAEREETRCIRVLHNQKSLLYTNWLEDNKRQVHTKSKGRLGYVHIPNMGPTGFSEFYRHYLSECRFEGLVVDVRFNGGGHVSEHILSLLSQKAIGYDVTRWHGIYTYPRNAAPDILVALTNEHAGSDGDIFCHAFKLLKLGPLVGTRTWGGVIGITGRHLVDGTYVSQPEYSHWFKDVGFGVENYGTMPDHLVDNDPNDEEQGRDRQLDKAIELALQALKKRGSAEPDFSTRPDLRPQPLPGLELH